MFNSFGILPLAQADEFHLPAPGVMVPLSPPLDPPMLKGIKIHPDNPFKFDFILDKGDSTFGNEQLKDESTKLIKYFLASLTIPEKDLWVNLSPYEKDRIIPQSFGLTEMGRDLLAEDYMLKQITASLIYPEDEIGKKFWKRVYEEAQKKFGTTDIPVNTFNKVWIMPEKAVVYENAKAGTAYVVESKLKVMLEQDYLALEKNISTSLRGSEGDNKNDVNALGSQIVREIVIPELVKEVNEDKNFSQLRQVYNSLILATWYKKKIKDSILEQVYADKKKVAGVGYSSSVVPGKVPFREASPAGNEAVSDTERIYQRYLQAFKKGVYNYIKEEPDPITQETIPRKYFSGGEAFFGMDAEEATTNDPASLPISLNNRQEIVGVNVTSAAMVQQTALPESKNGAMTAGELMKKLFVNNVIDLSTVKDALRSLESSPGAVSAEEFTRLGLMLIEKVRANEDKLAHGGTTHIANFIEAFLLEVANSMTLSHDIKASAEVYCLFLEHISHERAQRNKEFEQMHLSFNVKFLVEFMQAGIKKAVLNLENSTIPESQRQAAVNQITDDLAGEMIIESKKMKVTIDGQEQVVSTSGIAIEMAAEEAILKYIATGVDKAYAYLLFIALLKILQSPERMRRLDTAEFDLVVLNTMDTWVTEKEKNPSLRMKFKTLFEEVRIFSNDKLGFDISKLLDQLALWSNSDESLAMTSDELFEDIDRQIANNPSALPIKLNISFDGLLGLDLTLDEVADHVKAKLIDRSKQEIDKKIKDTNSLYNPEFQMQRLKELYLIHLKNSSNNHVLAMKNLIDEIDAGATGRVTFYRGLDTYIWQNFVTEEDKEKLKNEPWSDDAVKSFFEVKINEWAGIAKKQAEFLYRGMPTKGMFLFSSAAMNSTQLNLLFGGGSRFTREDVDSVKEVVKDLSERVNKIYDLTAGPFTVQQYIPVNYRDNKVGVEILTDIHGGHALWLVLKDLFQSEVFRKYYNIPGLSSSGEINENDRDLLLKEFVARGLITAEEQQELAGKARDLDNLLDRVPVSFDIRGVGSLKYRDIDDLKGHNNKQVEEFYKNYYENAKFINDILIRVLKKVIGEALPTNYNKVEAIPGGSGFAVAELDQGFYIDFEHRFHIKVAGEGEPVRVVVFPGEDIDQTLKSKPELMVNAFQWATEKNALMSDKVLGATTRQAAAVTEPSFEMNKAFLQLLRAKGKISLVLLKMYEAGLLGKFLPEFEELKYHFEVPSHRFSVPMHTLYLLYFLEYESGQDARLAETTENYHRVSVSSTHDLLATLRFSILRHDALKNDQRMRFSAPHTIIAAHHAPVLLDSFPYARDLRRDAPWLIRNHQLLSTIAANTKGKDFFFSDLLEIHRIGGELLDKDLLDLFYLLTVADASSVDPYSQYRGYLDGEQYNVTTRLFNRLSDYLEMNSPQQQREMATWKRMAGIEEQEIRKQTKESLGKSQFKLNTAINSFKPFASEDQIRNVQAMVKDADQLEPLLDQYLQMFPTFDLRSKTANLESQFILFVLVSLEHRDSLYAQTLVTSANTDHGPMFELTVGTSQDAPGTMYKIMGTLAAVGFNVMDAKINTTPNGAIFDRLHGYFLRVAPSPQAFWRELKNYLELRLRFLAHRLLDEGLANRPIQVAKLHEEIEEISKILQLENSKDHWQENLDWRELLPILIGLVIKGQITVDDIFNFNGAVRQFEWVNDINPKDIQASFETSSGARVLKLQVGDNDCNGFWYMVSRTLSERFGLNIEIAPVATMTDVTAEFNVSRVDFKTGRKKPLSQNEEREISEFLKAFISSSNAISQEDVLGAVKKTKRDRIRTAENWVDALGIPFGDKRIDAISLANELLNPGWVHEDQFKKPEIAQGTGSFANLKIISLEKFVQLVRGDYALLAKQNQDQGMQAPSLHLKTLGNMLSSIEARFKDLVINANEENLFRQFFQGREVLNIGLEEDTVSERVQENNIVTGLRKADINAYGLGPKLLEGWDPKIFKEGLIEKIPWPDASFDDLVIMSLLDPDYYDVMFHDLNKRYPADKDYDVIVREIKRVLKPGGRLYIDTNYNKNGLLIDALKRAQFDIKQLNTGSEATFIAIGPGAKGSPAMKTLANTGGIDLTRADMNLQTQNSGGEIKFHLDPAELLQLQNAPGFTPVITSIQPMTDLRLFLGLTNKEVMPTAAG